MGNERRPRRGAYGVPYTLPLWRYGPAAVRGRPHQRRKRRRMSGAQGGAPAPGLLVPHLPPGTRQLRHIRAVSAGTDYAAPGGLTACALHPAFYTGACWPAWGGCVLKPIAEAKLVT